MPDTGRPRSRTEMLMRKIYYLLLCLSAGLLAFSCVKDDTQTQGLEGEFSLALSADENVIATKSGGPDLADFAVWIENTKGQELKRWDSYADVPATIRFAVGNYVVKASYGDSTKSGFELPAFFGKQSVAVAYGDSKSVPVVCTYSKTLVSVEPKEGFANYYKDFSTEVSTTSTTPTVFVKGETRPGYFANGKLKAKVKVTRQDDSKFDASMPEIEQTLSAEHYTLTLDVNDGAGAIVFTLIETATNEVVVEKIIPLEAASNAPPYFVAEGFDLEHPVVTSPESYEKELSLLVKARGGIKSCLVTVSSGHLIGKGVPATFDLAATSGNAALQSALEAVGLVWSPGMLGSTMAEIDFSGVIEQLPALAAKPGEHTLTITVEDTYGRKTAALPLKMIILQPHPEIKNITRVADNIGGTAVEIDLTASLENGRWADLIGVRYQQGFTWVNVPAGNWSLTEDVDDPTLATIQITGLVNTQTEFPLRLVHKTPAPLSIERQSETVVGDLNAPVFHTTFLSSTLNTVRLEVEQVSGTETFNPASMSIVVRNQGSWEAIDKIQESFDPGERKVVYRIEGLTPSEKYRMRSRYDGRYDAETEAIFQTAGFSFEGWGSPTTVSLQKGPRLGTKSRNVNILNQDKTTTTYSTVSTSVIVQGLNDTYWCTTGAKTALSTFTNKNSWYVAPSTAQVSGTSGYGVRLSSVAWDNAGPALADVLPADPPKPGYLGTNTTTATLADATPPSVRYKAPGKLYLGTYSYVHNGAGGLSSETVNDTGLPLRSKPTALNFQYRFTPYGSEPGYALILLLDASGNEVGRGELSITDEQLEWKDQTVVINYSSQNKVARMKILFSTVKNEGNIPLNTNDRENCVAVGSMLDIDEVSLVY